MLENIVLNNFKRFETLSLDLKPITLISGENNTGKTSILESVFLLFDYITPQVFLKLQRFRGVEKVAHNPDSLWSPLFFDMNMNRTLSIHAEGSNGEGPCHRKVSFIRQDSLQTIEIPDEIKGKVTFSESSYSLRLDCETNDRRSQGYYVLDDGKIALVMPEKPVVEQYIHYIGPHVWPAAEMTADFFSKIELAGEKAGLIHALKLLDDKINDIMTLAINGIITIYISFSNGKKYPIDIMGDGIQKLLYVSLVLLGKPNCILLLDEAENGLHYSIYTKFWELLGSLAMKNNCQVIATTHSYECIDGALDGITRAGVSDCFKYLRLNNNNGQITAKGFSADALKLALSSNMEVR